MVSCTRVIRSKMQSSLVAFEEKQNERLVITS